MGGYAYTNAQIVSATSTAILPGYRIGLVPYNTVSLWNRYQFTPSWGAGVGVIYSSDFYASSDDSVLLPGFTRFDAAVYYQISEKWGAQLNVQNVLNSSYIDTADGNNNITPGSPRVFRLTLSTKL